MHLPKYSLVGSRKDGGELLDQMRSVAGLLELFNDTSDDVIFDSLDIDLCVVYRAG